MLKFIQIIFLLTLVSCGGSSESSEDSTTQAPNENVEDSTTQAPSDNVEDTNQLNTQAANSLSTTINIKLDRFYSEFDDERQGVARSLAASGRLSSGDHIAEVQELFETMFGEHKTVIVDDILAVHSIGNLLSTDVINEIDLINTSLENYIDETIVSSFDNLGMPSSTITYLKDNLNTYLTNEITLIELELQNFGVI